MTIQEKTKELLEVRKAIYEQLPEWRKFFYGWRSALNMAGFKALWSYPINYYKLWRMLKK